MSVNTFRHFSVHVYSCVYVSILFYFKMGSDWDFPASPVVKTPCFQCMGHEFYPWPGNKNPMFSRTWPKRWGQTTYTHLCSLKTCHNFSNLLIVRQLGHSVFFSVVIYWGSPLLFIIKPVSKPWSKQTRKKLKHKNLLKFKTTATTKPGFKNA